MSTKKIYRTLKAKRTWKRILIASFACVAFTVAVSAMIEGCKYLHYQIRGVYFELEKSVSENITMVRGSKAGYCFYQLKDKRTGKFTTPKLDYVFLNEYSDDSLVVFRDLDDKRGFLNTNTGHIVIPAQYDRAWNFSEGLAAVIKDGTISFINENGEPAFPATFPLHFDDTQADLAFQFHQGLCVMISWDHKWGLINTHGEWVVEPIYAEINKPCFGYRIVSDGKHYALLTASGQTALPLEYDIIRHSSDNLGFFIAKDGYAKEVDKHLKTIIPFVHDGIFQLSYVDNFRDYDYDDEEDAKAPEPKYWRYDVGMYSGMIDNEGRVIIPAKYHMVRMVNEHLFEVEVTYGGDRILINDKGQYVGK